MKHFSNILKYSLFLSLVVAIVSCGGSDDDPAPSPDELIAIAEALTKGEASFKSVSEPTDATELDWSNLVVKFNGGVDGGTYTTTGSANANVWPASGTWTFKDDTGKTLVRDGSTDVTVAVSATELNTTFTVVQPETARTKVVGGEWSFALSFPAE
ncbi:hypothetical protein N7E81_00445 [Reichenbachiella carrageenanivorans]|uniref:Lipocalin-like domain-containing protein n=1 Tax=Reichenbachiella carrageenanivorans TaxID=2979869 RepID=A0ABY6D398_9BACT|nr:hypothetical protein [Reichenbachiella carrageenanivorans]UXX79578.1 hypothetical protein N7E81_00445 [Reichenbachiella carrageenanivorans]